MSTPGREERQAPYALRVLYSDPARWWRIGYDVDCVAIVLIAEALCMYETRCVTICMSPTCHSLTRDEHGHSLSVPRSFSGFPPR